MYYSAARRFGAENPHNTTQDARRLQSVLKPLSTNQAATHRENGTSVGEESSCSFGTDYFFMLYHDTVYKYCISSEANAYFVCLYIFFRLQMLYFLNFLNVLLQIWAIKDIATTSARTRLSVPMTVVSMMHFMNLSVQRSFLPQHANSVHACPPKVK